MTLVWDKFPGAGSELLVMLAFADWCNDQGESLHPSIPTVARKIRASESQARRLVHGLIKHGWVSVIGNEFGGAPGNSRRYRLNLSKLAETGSTHATPRIDATPSTDARDGSHGRTKTPSTHARQSTNTTVIETTTTARPLDWSARGLKSFTDDDRVVVVSLVEGHDPQTKQALLDEFAALIEDKAVRNSPMALLAKLAAAARAGTFVLNRGLRVRDERIARAVQPATKHRPGHSTETPYANAVAWAHQQFQITGDRAALKKQLAAASSRWPEEASKSSVEASAHGKRRVRQQPRQTSITTGVTP